MVTFELRATLSEDEAFALRHVLDRQIDAIKYIERRESQDIPEEIKHEKQAATRILRALEEAMQRETAN